MKLQSVLYPTEDICNEEALYLHRDGSLLSFDGYFNLFYLEKHHKYCDISCLSLELAVNGIPPKYLSPCVTAKEWSADQKLELISRTFAGEPVSKVAESIGIGDGMLHQWIRRYKMYGYNGLVNKRRGRKSKRPKMKKQTNPTPLTESEREELIRLRAEVEYIKAENEVIKKEIALREEKEAARLKAKKQQSLQNSATKDSD